MRLQPEYVPATGAGREGGAGGAGREGRRRLQAEPRAAGRLQDRLLGWWQPTPVAAYPGKPRQKDHAPGEAGVPSRRAHDGWCRSGQL
eukprot:scaffold106671_cov48-Phaeocystis_antarctica.AAC.1